MKSGFVNIFGKPNAGKSTLLNALMGEKLAIVSPKVQTTRHRIKGILNDKNYKIIFSDTTGIIEPKYKLHEKMIEISALKNKGIKELLDAIVSMLPEGEPFYADENLSDLPMKFFVSELI